jgi:hypothetical protein
MPDLFKAASLEDIATAVLINTDTAAIENSQVKRAFCLAFR